MAAGRFISKQISGSERVADLPGHLDRLIYTWLIPHADVCGRLPGRPRKLIAMVCPMLGVSAKEMGAVLKALAAQDLIELYTDHDGREVVQICGFERHQTIRKDREAASKFGPKNGAGAIPEHSRSSPGVVPEPDEPSGCNNITPGVLPECSGVARVKVNEIKVNEEEEEHAAAPSLGVDPRVIRLAAEIAKFKSLGKVGGRADRLAFCEALIGIMDAKAIGEADALGAIGEAAAECDLSKPPAVVRRIVRKFVQHSRPRSETDHQVIKAQDAASYRAANARRHQAARDRDYDEQARNAIPAAAVGDAAKAVLESLKGQP